MIRKIINKIKSKIYPSSHALNMKRWLADGGDFELRFNYDLNEKSIVLDLGGYEGQWASDLFSRYCSNIFIFEPVYVFAERIKKRFQKNKKIEVCQWGLGYSTRIQTMHLFENESSLFGKSSKCEEIKILDVKEWIDIRQILKIDLVKINIEGGEYELLNRLIETKLIERINNIQVQFHEVAATSLSEMNRIRQELSKTHKPVFQYEFVWESWVKK